jgi:hypothetical protein
MNSNSLPQKPGDLIQLGGKMEDGIKTVGSSVPVVLVTAVQMHDDTDAFSKADNDFNAGRSAEQAASDSYQATLGSLYTWLLAVSNLLVTLFGTRWNTAWAQAGFVNHTTAIPPKIADRISLSLALVQFFTKNPNYEVPSLKLTAADGTAVRGAVLDTQDTLTKATMAQQTTGDRWTAAYDKLVATMTDLLKNLEAKLKSDDTRWLAFGLRIPATITTPGQPVNVSAHLDGTGAIILQCDAVPNATRYRGRMMILGVDTAYKLAASSTEPIMTISGVLPGQTVQLIVQAVNGNLQGVASDPIQFTVLIPAAKTVEAKAAPVSETAEPGTNGNGHRNGQANGVHSRAA